MKHFSFSCFESHVLSWRNSKCYKNPCDNITLLNQINGTFRLRWQFIKITSVNISKKRLLKSINEYKFTFRLSNNILYRIVFWNHLVQILTVQVRFQFRLESINVPLLHVRLVISVCHSKMETSNPWKRPRCDL